MSYTVEIEHRPTGERRIWANDNEWYGSFIWEDGNYACDCNRGLFWKRAVGDDERDDEDGYPCDGNVFRVVAIKDERGNILYSEED